jgi:glycosyltransferase involved in cell wall biosynthesis
MFDFMLKAVTATLVQNVRSHGQMRDAAQTEERSARPRLAILVNIIAPYRLPIYKALTNLFDLAVFYGSQEQKNRNWSGLAAVLPEARVKQSWGLRVGFKKKSQNKTYDFTFLHLHPGYFVDLVRFRPDAVISNEMGFRTLIALSYGVLFGKPVWVWWGGTVHTERGRGWLRKQVRMLLARRVGHWISYGDSSTQYLLSLGVKRETVLQIQNCVEEERYTKKVTMAFEATPKPVFLTVGQMIGRKGLAELLEVSARLVRAGFQFSLVFVGGGPAREELENNARRLSLDNVRFFPPFPYEAMASVYRSADFFIFPTLEDVWGLVVNEALWSGLPTLCSKYAGCAAELLPESNIFDPYDLEDFERVMVRALSGKIAKADVSGLKRFQTVSQMIADSVLKQLHASQADVSAR